MTESLRSGSLLEAAVQKDRKVLRNEKVETSVIVNEHITLPQGPCKLIMIINSSTLDSPIPLILDPRSSIDVKIRLRIIRYSAFSFESQQSSNETRPTKFIISMFCDHCVYIYNSGTPAPANRRLSISADDQGPLDPC